jgi:carboxyl-terminal processing protease
VSNGRTRPKTIALAAILAIVLVAGAWMFQRGTTTTKVNGTRLFSQVSSIVRDNYVDTVSDPHMYQLALDGMLSELDDPYDAYLTPQRLENLSERTSGVYAGIGLQVDVRDGSLVVVSPLPGGPGEKAGILTGDRIVQIDGKTVSGWTAEEVQKLLRGAPGSPVEVAIQHAGSATPITLKLVRASIHHSAIKRAALLPSSVGYVALTVFSDSTARELKTTVDSLVQAGATSLLLDLRANPGGLLDQGVAVADLFLDRGERVASTAGRDSSDNVVFTDTAAQRWPKLTVAILVDDKSASAAEVVAGALQDHDRAVVLGMTTYGKGSVQHIFPV